MSDKLIRDELLRSHRYQTLSTDTLKLFFIHLLLSSDGHSNAETTTTALSIIMGRPVHEETAAALLAELADRDLVRLYEADGKRYAHIPRSRQRIKYPTAKHPRPPASIEDKKISELISKVSTRAVLVPPQVGPSPAEVKRSEEKRSKTYAPRPISRKTALPEGFSITDRVRLWADAKGYSKLQERFEHFVGVARAKAYTYADWDEALMGAIRKDWAGLGGPVSNVRKLAL